MPLLLYATAICVAVPAPVLLKTPVAALVKLEALPPKLLETISAASLILTVPLLISVRPALPPLPRIFPPVPSMVRVPETFVVPLPDIVPPDHVALVTFTTPLPARVPELKVSEGMATGAALRKLIVPPLMVVEPVTV